MSFTTEEMNQLKKSPYVKAVHSDQIIYGRFFYQEFYRITNLGYSGEEAFDFLGLDPKIVGEVRIRRFKSRLKKLIQKNKLFEDKDEEKMSISQQLKYKDSEIKRLQQEVDFLKKRSLFIGSTRTSSI